MDSAAGSNGRSDHNFASALLSSGSHCRFGRRARSQPIIDEQYGLSAEIKLFLAESQLVGLKPFPFLGDDLFQFRAEKRILLR